MWNQSWEVRGGVGVGGIWSTVKFWDCKHKLKRMIAISITSSLCNFLLVKTSTTGQRFLIPCQQTTFLILFKWNTECWCIWFNLILWNKTQFSSFFAKYLAKSADLWVQRILTHWHFYLWREIVMLSNQFQKLTIQLHVLSLCNLNSQQQQDHNQSEHN